MTTTYEDQVLRMMALLRAERPNEDDWIGWVIHERGECIECDALRRLEVELDD